MAGGGTGGHLFPALAVVKELEELYPCEAHFVGTSRGIEADIIPGEGYPLHTIVAEGFRGRGIRKLRALGKVVVGFCQSLTLIFRLKPLFVLGVGGYASLPVGLAAFFSRRPLFLHEQNAVPGLANRLLAPLAKRFFLTYSSTASYLGKANTLVTGNPVRRELFLGRRDPSRFDLPDSSKVVLIFGGSQGARSINEAIIDDLKVFKEHRNDIAFIHQTGGTASKEVAEAYRREGLTAHVTPFIYDMAHAYATASLVVCRAGATTISEVTALGKPSILIPFPHAVGDHQLQNAKMLEKEGASQVLREEEMGPGVLGKRILELVFHEDRLAEMGGKALKLGRPEAGKEIAVKCWREAVGEG